MLGNLLKHKALYIFATQQLAAMLANFASHFIRGAEMHAEVACGDACSAHVCLNV